MENIRVFEHQTDPKCYQSLNLENGHTSSLSSLSSSSSCLSSVCGDQDGVVMQRCAVQLHSLSGVCVFRSLRACVLCDNFIIDIEPLRQCVNLLKLDLKGNKVHLTTSLTQCVQAGERWVNNTLINVHKYYIIIITMQLHTLKLFTEGKKHKLQK